MPLKRQSDEVAARSGMGGRIGYHEAHGVVPLGCLPLSLLVVGITVPIAFNGTPLIAIIPACIIVGCAALLLWPIGVVISGVGVYDQGLTIAVGRQVIAVPWSAITRVSYVPLETKVRYPTARVRYAYIQLAVTGESMMPLMMLGVVPMERVVDGATDLPVTLVHLWRHKELLRAIQAGAAR
jgi:hypothetical protein